MPDSLLLTPGTRLQSQVCATQMIVIRAGRDVDLRCGGAPVIPLDAEPDAVLTLDPAFSDGSRLGKRLVSPTHDGLEVLVTQAGKGTLTDGPDPLVEREARQLPATD